jgi:hypothetical protein
VIFGRVRTCHKSDIKVENQIRKSLGLLILTAFRNRREWGLSFGGAISPGQDRLTIPSSGETWSVLVGVCPGTKQGVPHGSPSIILCTFAYKFISNLHRVDEIASNSASPVCAHLCS